MKCMHCGKDLKVGSVYCEACGKPAQIVPDYNILEDEILTSLLEEKKEDSSKKKSIEDSSNDSAKNNSNNDKNFFQKIWAKKKLRICFILAMLLIIFVATLGSVLYVNSYSYQYKQGMKYDKKNQYETAIEHYLKAVSAKDSSINARLAIGKDYFQLKEYEKAEKILLEAIELDTSNEAVFKELIQVYLTTDSFDKIEELEEKTDSKKILALFDKYLVTPPTFSEDEGEFDDDIKLELTTTEGDIYYTLDGSNPTKGAALKYNEEIELKDGTTTVKAVCKNDSGEYSQVISKKYKITYKAPDYPIVNPMSGNFTSPTQITIEAAEGASIYYTWDGSVPSASSAQYIGPIDVAEGNNVLSILVIDKHGLCSDILRCNYKYLP